MRKFFTQSISRLVMGSFVFVLLLPLGFIISNLSQLSWDSAQKEMQEKHLLLAKSLKNPVSQYFSSNQQALKILIESSDFASKNSEDVKAMMDGFVNSVKHITAISFLPTEYDKTIISINDSYKMKASVNSFGYHDTERKYRKYDTANSISSVVRSTISNKPIVLMKHHIIGSDMNKKGTIIVELELQPIRDICEKIRFGENGHCVIIDQLGQVVAHPGEDYVNGIRDISATGIVKIIKNNGNGLMTFDSPYLGEKVVSGYTIVDGLGWGIMILQPKSELQSPFKSVINTVLTWLAVGIIVSLLVAYILAQQITKPLNSLVTKSKEIGTRSDTFNLGQIPKNSPNEVSELWGALSALVSRLHKSNREVRKLNYSLSKDIEKATEKLRATNRYLYKISSNDHLTKIANRRYFEDSVSKILKKGVKEKMGIILIDVDKFKFINDEYGHEAGDLALKHIARIMQKSTRKGDIPARLGGDEFVVYIRNCSDKVLMNIADSMRKKVESNPINWEGQSIKLSLSVGTVNYEIDKTITLDQLLKYADEAMYESKEAGRNNVSAYVVPETTSKKEKKEEVKKIIIKEDDDTSKGGLELASEIETLLEELPHESLKNHRKSQMQSQKKKHIKTRIVIGK